MGLYEINYFEDKVLGVCNVIGFLRILVFFVLSVFLDMATEVGKMETRNQIQVMYCRGTGEVIPSS